MTFLGADAALGVTLFSKADRNLKAPTGSLANSGNQYEGTFNEFLGTGIAKHYFITAGHIGGSVGDRFVYNGVSYKAVATYNDPETDLQVWQVHGNLPHWSPMNTSTSETGRTVMIYGRGTARGPEITVDGETKGWYWGTADSKTSWGRNVIGGAVAGKDDNGNDLPNSELYWTFDANGIAHEGTLTSGDSGGGVFAQFGGVWNLVGVNNSVQSTFSFSNGGATANGAIYDFGGLYANNQLVADNSMDIPTRSFATRISTNIGWVNDVIAGNVTPSLVSAVATAGEVPEPAGICGLLFSFGLLVRLGAHR